MARADDPRPPLRPPTASRTSATARLPLAPSLACQLRRQGRKDKSRGAARPSEEEARLPAPPRAVCSRSRAARPCQPRWGRGLERGAGPTARVRAAALLRRLLRRLRALRGARFKPGRSGPVEQEGTRCSWRRKRWRNYARAAPPQRGSLRRRGFPGLWEEACRTPARGARGPPSAAPARLTRGRAPLSLGLACMKTAPEHLFPILPISKAVIPLKTIA
ncbi:PREDICTED: uncharacterized protein LOC105816350 [Propithecus coquereli]|uniref:uncharacterized protein LOC105816350 n=1 Tax=Propithecus coquereli TaxID=379532 RepID=UPI00063F5DAE|nr:PREDICTED: uncharacterized protein LOC105816350 [Propithecus coquereli]